MTTTEQTALPSVYSPDYDQTEFERALAETVQATEVERIWMQQSGQVPYDTDQDILRAVGERRLVKVVHGLGYSTIPKLKYWSPERSNPDHKFHYSPPYLTPPAALALDGISWRWSQQTKLSQRYSLSVTSVVRSRQYGAGLNQTERKLTIPLEVGDSSHSFGQAMDIDGCGLYLRQGGRLIPIHPRLPSPSEYDQHKGAAVEARDVLRTVLDELKAADQINYLEELPGTQQHCFHVCVNPNSPPLL